MIQSIFGPMFSGKTSELMRRIRRHRLAQKHCLVINFSKDNRYTNKMMITSHDNISIPALKVSKLSEIPESELKDKEVIGIDEGQFFEDIIEKSEEWANMGKIVIVAALDCTFQMKPFKRVTDLLAISETVNKLTSVCLDCGNDAAFTKRTNNDESVQLIGGIEIYKPVCRNCYWSENQNQSNNSNEKTIKKEMDKNENFEIDINKFKL